MWELILSFGPSHHILFHSLQKERIKAFLIIQTPQEKVSARLFPLTFPTLLNPRNLQPTSVWEPDWTQMNPK